MPRLSYIRDGLRETLEVDAENERLNGRRLLRRRFHHATPLV
jgi:hypothetical protein